MRTLSRKDVPNWIAFRVASWGVNIWFCKEMFEEADGSNGLVEGPALWSCCAFDRGLQTHQIAPLSGLHYLELFDIEIACQSLLMARNFHHWILYSYLIRRYVPIDFNCKSIVSSSRESSIEKSNYFKRKKW